MTRPDRSDRKDSRLALEPDDAHFVERLRRGYAPEPEDAVRRTAFDAALRERIEAESRTRWRWTPALAGAALTLAAAWLGLRILAPQPLAERAVPVAEARVPVDAEALAWEESLFFPTALGSQGDSEELPDDYQAIASVFLDARPSPVIRAGRTRVETGEPFFE